MAGIFILNDTCGLRVSFFVFSVIKKAAAIFTAA